MTTSHLMKLFVTALLMRANGYYQKSALSIIRTLASQFGFRIALLLCAPEY
jgi:hypothetical protein